MKQIEKSEVFNEILNGNDVYIVKDMEWVNALATGDIVNLPSGSVFLVDAKPKVVQRKLDIVKLTNKMHDENMSQQDLAKIAGISQPQVNRYIHGHAQPRTEALERICKALKCEKWEILDD